MQRKKKSKTKSPMIRLVGLEAAVAVSGLAGSLGAVAAPGDLDPSFGDVGRQSGIQIPYYAGLWSVDVQPDDSVLFGGGGEYEYWGTYIDDFVGRLLPSGGFDAGFVAAALPETAIYDTTLQSDGKLVGVGVALQADGTKKLLVFRLLPDGSLDSGFGLGGQVLISDGTVSRESGYSVLVDLDGHIVVAGQRDNKLLVTRLLGNGALDAGFGTGGVYVDPKVPGPVRIVSAPAGGYRVAVQFNAGVAGFTCAVTGLTAVGSLDAAFGAGGYVTLESPGDRSVWCNSLAVQPDGRILLGGNNDQGDGYLGRLLANGANDPAFAAGAASGRFDSVSALAVGTNGSIFVTGRDRSGFAGAVIVRLLSDGTLDTTFGRDGETTVNLNSRRGSLPVINDMKVTGGGGLVVGGNFVTPRENGGFVARLLGDTPGGGPGVLGFKQSRSRATEQTGQVVVSVQRTGGSRGAVAVKYSTHDFVAGTQFSPGALANSGSDYTSTTGRLTWADGDVGEREIIVPLASDTNAEPSEFFEIVLESPEGGAGLATFGADLEIAGEIIAQPPAPVVQPPKSNRGGGGSFGWLGAILLGFGGAFRRR